MIQAVALGPCLMLLQRRDRIRSQKCPKLSRLLSWPFQPQLWLCKQDEIMSECLPSTINDTH